MIIPNPDKIIHWKNLFCTTLRLASAGVLNVWQILWLLCIPVAKYIIKYHWHFNIFCALSLLYFWFLALALNVWENAFCLLILLLRAIWRRLLGLGKIQEEKENRLGVLRLSALWWMHFQRQADCWFVEQRIVCCVSAQCLQRVVAAKPKPNAWSRVYLKL